MKKIITLFVWVVVINSSTMFSQTYYADTWYEVNVSSATLYSGCIQNEDPTCWNGSVTTAKGQTNPYNNPSPAGSYYTIKSDYNFVTWDGTSIGYVTEWTGVVGLTNPIRPSKVKFKIPGSMVPVGGCKTFYLWEIPCNYIQLCNFAFPNPMSITVCNPNSVNPCVSSVLSVSNGLNCVTFTRANSTCSLCYCVRVKFTDDTTTSFYLNFGSGNTLMNCFSKPISSVLTIEASTNCGGCASGTTFKQAQELPAAKDEINLIEKERIIVSPNPTKSLIKFDGIDLNKYQISIYDIAGKEIIKKSKIENEINLEKQSNGTYIYIITDENGYKQQGKIVKE